MAKKKKKKQKQVIGKKRSIGASQPQPAPRMLTEDEEIIQMDRIAYIHQNYRRMKGYE